MKKHLILSLVLSAFALVARAEILPAEKILPKDTLLMFTIPDVGRLRASLTNSSQGQLWDDAAIKPFKDKFTKKFSDEIMAPLEKELGVKFADYEGLAQGQVTIAVIQNGWQGNTNEEPAVVFLLDSKDRSGQLKKSLGDLKKKWTDSGKKFKSDRIRDIEFTTLILAGDDLTKSLEKALPGFGGPKPGDPAGKPDGDQAAKSTSKTEVTVGQVESLLIVGTSTKVIEKLLIRMSGGLVPTLLEDPVYEANHNALFRDAQAFGWANAKAFIEIVNKQLKGEAAPENPLMPSADKLMVGLGVNGLKSAAFSYRDTAEGSLVQFFVGVPEAGRVGLFKILAAAAKPSGPPEFVPNDTVKFTRWRLDMQKAWNSLETMITGISPAAGGAFKLIFESAGRDKDPDYDLRREFIGNLGDDIISYDKSPRTPTVADLSAPPSLTLLGSPNPERLANGIKVLMATLGQGAGGLKEREFLGRKIYSLSLPGAMPGPDGQPKLFSFVGSGGYVAMSADVALLEEYLRSSENKPKPLMETPGLADAAQKVGGMNSGLFGYASHAGEMKAWMETMKKDPAGLDALLGLGGLGPTAANGDGAKKLKEWFDVSLLPPYDAIAKYFHFSVYGGSFTPDGFLMKVFAPIAPGLKK